MDVPIRPSIGSVQASDEMLDYYDSRRYACYRCSVPDIEVVKISATENHIRLRCPVNRYAPLAGRVNNCPCFDEIPGYAELWAVEEDQRCWRGQLSGFCPIFCPDREMGSSLVVL